MRWGSLPAHPDTTFSIARIHREREAAVARYQVPVPQILDRVSVGAMTRTEVVAGLDTHPDTTFTIARIERDREAAAGRFLRDRDTRALEQAMSRLDAEEASARASTQGVSAAEAVAWLHDLPALWASADDSGRRLLTEAIFEKVEVLGVQSVTIHPAPEADAHGWKGGGPGHPAVPPPVRTGTRGQYPGSFGLQAALYRCGRIARSR